MSCCLNSSQSTKAETVQELCHKKLALKSNCLHPTTNEPYVKTAVGGKDNSPEGAQAGITYGFLVEFANDEDRQYYLEKDPAHIEFKAAVAPAVTRAQVIDFVSGVF
ncbi:Stress responsive alpha-beta barrel [Lasallia pustulata]|uniref:Stress responsive alpha-beta barrel n=1 Tax=Lasallia pustulata TaxID=136370 RepID=A0A1W5D115_9LECA|nr:Stress responsive alpha-beta barrel [Lasallia pustulata]